MKHSFGAKSEPAELRDCPIRTKGSQSSRVVPRGFGLRGGTGPTSDRLSGAPALHDRGLVRLLARRRILVRLLRWLKVTPFGGVGTGAPAYSFKVLLQGDLVVVVMAGSASSPEGYPRDTFEWGHGGLPLRAVTVEVVCQPRSSPL